MGTCQCERNNSSKDEELSHFFTRNHESTNNINNNSNTQINSNIKINMINSKNQEEPNQIEEENIIEISTKRQKIKDISNIHNVRLINNFISKNLNRIYNKDKYNKLKAQTKKMFFEIEEKNFNFDQAYFKHLFDSKLSKFLNNKDNIIKDLFSEKFRKTLYSFPKLKEVLNNEHNNYIFNNHKEFLNEFMSYGITKNIINIDLIEPKVNKQISMVNVPQKNNDIIKRNNIQNNIFGKGININLKKIDNNSKNKKGDKVNKIFRTSKTRNFGIKRNIEEVKNNSFEKEKNNIEDHFNLTPVKEKITIENIIKKELDKFYEVCFTTKIPYSDFEKESIFFNLITSEEQEKATTLELKNLINVFYYLYLLKKYDFLSDTNRSFYKINPVSIKRKSIITNKIILNRKQSTSKKENTIKMKILKGLFNNKNNEESEESDSLSSILSEDDKKECNSLISTNNDLRFLKYMPKNKTDKQNSSNNKNNIFLIEEEKTEDIKSENNKSAKAINMEKIELKEKDKNSFQRKSSKDFNIFHNKIKRTSINTNYSEYYNGQYDNTIYLYAGLGTLVNQNMKKLYHGTFRYGKKEGLGIMYQFKEESNMEYYMGEFHKNKISGFGIKLLINNSELIHREGIFDGDYLIKGKYKKIILKSSNTIITINYKGEFENSKFSGTGKLVEKTYIFDQKTGTYEIIQIIEYIGEFFNDKKNGKGKEVLKHYKYSNKSYKYEGNFINDVKDGYGVITYDKTNFVHKYEGFFVKDKPFQIYGIINFKSGDIYEGFFENNLKDNVGLYLFIDSKSKTFIEEYFGGFLEDYKDGIGRTVVKESGESKMLRGNYKKGDKEGQFVKVVYKNDEMRNKKRRYAATEDTFLGNYFEKERKGNKLPRIQIKSFPIYEENEIIDVNDNYLYDLDH